MQSLAAWRRMLTTFDAPHTLQLSGPCLEMAIPTLQSSLASSIMEISRPSTNGGCGPIIRPGLDEGTSGIWDLSSVGGQIYRKSRGLGNLGDYSIASYYRKMSSILVVGTNNTTVTTTTYMVSDGQLHSFPVSRVCHPAR